MSEKMIRGRQVNARFREHVPATQDIAEVNNEPVAAPERVTAPEAVAVMKTPQLEVSLPQADEVLDLDVPALDLELDLGPAHEHTARAVEANGA